MPQLSATQIQRIQHLMRDCGQQCQQMATQQFQVYEKGREDYVTTVDRELDRQLAAGFLALFPEDGIITEENTASWPAFGEAYRRLWLIDPLDGTEDFIAGKPDYAVMVGLLEDYQPRAGWIYAPAFDRLYYGGTDWGLFQLDKNIAAPLVPTEPSPPSSTHCPILIGHRDRRHFGEAISALIPEAEFDCIGSFGLKVMRVICGQAGLYIYLNRRVKLWDTTGPLALAQQAGLVCCDLDGHPLKFSPDAVDANTLIHQQPILVGWPRYLEALRSRLQLAVAQSPSHKP